jgi:hypothetical protein
VKHQSIYLSHITYVVFFTFFNKFITPLLGQEPDRKTIRALVNLSVLLLETSKRLKIDFFIETRQTYHRGKSLMALNMSLFEPLAAFTPPNEKKYLEERT